MKLTYNFEAIILQLSARNSYIKLMFQLTKKNQQSEIRKTVYSNLKQLIQTLLLHLESFVFLLRVHAQLILAIIYNNSFKVKYRRGLGFFYDEKVIRILIEIFS